MSIFKCKMCGGDLEITEGVSVCECEYCGTKQTVPSADNEKKMTLFGRANRLRFNNEFDKAAGVYESIVADFPEEAEAYWGLVLCKYGIEYVDDPATSKKIPTCHRSSFESVMDDSNFEQTLENADTLARGVYREEAKQIEELRKGIIEVSSKEEPYDIFICYKETAENGNRTIDSVIAQDVYDALTEKGYRVFFSRISLEDKLGVEYEPYIFAALNSAKIMLAFGTDYGYYNAVWVKNEWSRFLQLIAKGEKKTLIPCYKGIDAYDMPKEFAKLQAQDMGKVGAIQDLLRGIEKILPKNAKNAEAVNVQQSAPAAPGVDSLLERAFMFLEDGKWDDANTYCDKVLDIDPKCARAYLGKLMAELHVDKKEKLSNCKQPFDQNTNYLKIIRFGDERLKKELETIGKSIKDKKELERKTELYNKANTLMESASSEDDYKRAFEQFQKISGFKDSDLLKDQCLNAISNVQSQKAYDIAIKEMKSANTEKTLVAVAKKFELLNDFKDAREKAKKCYDILSSIIERNSKKREYAILFEKALVMPSSTLLALSDKGKVFSYGDNGFGCAETDDWKNVVAISSGIGFTVGLLSDGSLISTEEKISKKNVSWIAPYENRMALYRRIKEFKNAVDIIALREHIVILCDDGTIQCSNQYLQEQTKNWRNIIKIRADDRSIAGIRSDGTVVATDGFLLEKSINEWKSIIDIAIVPMRVGNESVLFGLSSDGRVMNTVNFPYDPVNQWNNVISIVNRGVGLVALRSDGTVLAWGRNDDHQCDVDNWNEIVYIARGTINCTIGLRSDGKVVCTSNGKGFPRYEMDLYSWDNIVAIAANDNFVAGLKSDGKIVTNRDFEYGDTLEKSFSHVKRNGYISDWKLFDNIADFKSINERAKQFNVLLDHEQKNMADGKCRYCGGKLKGLIAKKCVNCGKPKDY